MKGRIKVELSFTVIAPEGLDGLNSNTLLDFIEAGLEKAVKESCFPLDIEKGARLNLTCRKQKKEVTA